MDARGNTSSACSLLEHHVIHSRVIVPGAAHLEFVLALLRHKGMGAVLKNVSFTAPLLLPSQDARAGAGGNMYVCELSKDRFEVRFAQYNAHTAPWI